MKWGVYKPNPRKEDVILRPSLEEISEGILHENRRWLELMIIGMSWIMLIIGASLASGLLFAFVSLKGIQTLEIFVVALPVFGIFMVFAATGVLYTNVRQKKMISQLKRALQSYEVALSTGMIKISDNYN